MSDKHRNQAERILRLLEIADSWAETPWVPLPAILKLGIASHTRRIYELRAAGHEIEIRNEYVDGQRQVAYRLIRPDKKAVA